MSTLDTDADRPLAARLSPATHRRSARPVDDVPSTLRGLTRQVLAVAHRPNRPDAGVNDVIDVPHLVDFANLVHCAKEAERIAVAHCRGLGYSWAEIGSALGITKQSAQQRFS